MSKKSTLLKSDSMESRPSAATKSKGSVLLYLKTEAQRQAWATNLAQLNLSGEYITNPKDFESKLEKKDFLAVLIELDSNEDYVWLKKLNLKKQCKVPVYLIVDQSFEGIDEKAKILEVKDYWFKPLLQWQVQSLQSLVLAPVYEFRKQAKPEKITQDAALVISTPILKK